MATYRFYLYDSKAKNDTYVILRLADKNQTYKFYTDLKIHPKDWNKINGEARKTLDGYSDFNDLLAERKKALKKIHLNLLKEEIFSPELLRQTFYEKYGKVTKEDTLKGDFKTVVDFVRSYIQSIEGVKNKNTVKTRKETLRLLVEFETVKRKKITFERVNLDFYNDLIEYLTRNKNYSPNTIGKHIKTLKLFLNEATERGINTKFDYKSKRFKITDEQVESIYLTEAELERIADFDFSNNKRLEQTRDLFLIGCWSGLRFSDFSQLQSENIQDGEIKIRTQKTGELVVIPIHYTLKPIFKKYSDTLKGLPRPISNQKMNQYLKEIASKAGIDENILITKTKGGMKIQNTIPKFEMVTTHTARRSFATNLYLSGYPAIGIMKITSHRTEKAFMRYIKISTEENAKLLSKHWQDKTKLKVA